VAQTRGVDRREFLAGGSLGLLIAAGRLETAAAAQPRRDSAALSRLLERMEAEGNRHWSTPRKDAELLHLLVQLARARSVLEVGTSQGYSAIWMALALEETGGRLTTIDIDPERHALALKNLQEAGVAPRVTPILGDAHRELARLPGPFDFVFLDADKEGQVDYFRQLHPARLAPGALLAVHNAIRQADAMRDYLELVRRHPDFDTVTVSATLDDGFALSRRRP